VCVCVCVRAHTHTCIQTFLQLELLLFLRYDTSRSAVVWNTQCFLYFRFERGPSFRVRDERRNESDHRTKVDVRHSRDRYPESSKGRKD
jgi:hypothetical protein